MVCKVLSFINKHNMLNRGDSVVVALSGGADSMALLHILLSLKDELGISVCAAHVNHCLRGDESERDEAFVRQVCGRLGVVLHVLRADVAAESKRTGEGTEECGRRIRYEFFESVDGVSKIATAHTLSDDTETLLFNLARGSGLNGLCGIPPVRKRVIRPLITCTRSDVEEYCKENNINFVTDKTNFENDYNRNKIRNLVIPHLREINPSFETAVGRCVESLAEDEDCLTSFAAALAREAQTDKGFQASVLLAAHTAVRKRAINLILRERMNEKPQKCHIDLVDSILAKGGAVQTQKNVTATVKNGFLSFKSEREPLAAWVVGMDGEAIDFPYGKICLRKINSSELKLSQFFCKQVLANCLDCDRIDRKSFFRSRLEGDKITQPRGGCTKTLKKLFNEKRIPAEDRNGIVVLADDEGVLWVEGYGCDRRAMITDETQTVLMIGVERHDDINR